MMQVIFSKPIHWNPMRSLKNNRPTSQKGNLLPNPFGDLDTLLENSPIGLANSKIFVRLGSQT